MLRDVAAAVWRWQQVAKQRGLADVEIEQMAPAFALLDDVRPS